MHSYGDPEYWEKRYDDQKGKTFDWLEDYDALSPILKQLITVSSKILILGCGNAEFSEELYQDGYQNITNIDISPSVIQQMKDRNLEKPEMTWTVMDVRDLKFPSNYFDIAIDKSTIDALLCGDEAYINVARMTKEVQRVLKTEGVYMVISYGIPETRMDHFTWKHLHWEVSSQTLNESTANAHYIYLCRKLPDADTISENNWKEVEDSLCEQQEEEIEETADF